MTLKYNLFFTKTVASGNDFIILDDKAGELKAKNLDYSEIAKDICRRKFSVGADGLLVLEASDKASFKMRIINPDGSEVDMCGNGARASSLYAASAGWGEDLVLETAAGLLEAAVTGTNVKLKMSEPKDIELNLKLGVENNLMIVHKINTGVPHVVHLVDDLDKYDVKGVGRMIRQHTLFAPEGTNADFVGEVDEDKAKVRVYERGVEDETLACGTGTVASAIVLGLLGYSKSPVDMTTKSGEVLKVHFNAKGEKITDVYLEGKASLVCEGKI